MPTHETLPTHPATGLRALGVLPSGRVVWPVMGGDGNGDGGDGQGGNANGGQQGTGGTGGDSSQNGNANGQQGGQEPPQLGPDGQPWDADRASRLVANLRAELAELKGKQQTGAQTQGQDPAPKQDPAGQGPATDDGTADKLAAAQTELAVYRNAAKHGAHADRLTDSKSFMDTIGKLDPAADGYDKKVGDAIKKAITDHPHYAAGQVHGGGSRGGSDGTGRPGAPQTPASLAEALAAHYGGQNR